eukprot:67140_1
MMRLPTAGTSYYFHTHLFLFFFQTNGALFRIALVSIIASSCESQEALRINATDYLSYIVGIGFVACLFLKEYWRQKSLSHFGVLLVVPIFTVTRIIMTSVIGMIYFQEYHYFTAETDAPLYALGIIITVCGVAVLSRDIAKVWSELYDDDVKVAYVCHYVNYDRRAFKYPRTVVYGGPISEYYQNYHLKKPAVCYNKMYDRVVRQESAQLMQRDMQHVVQHCRDQVVRQESAQLMMQRGMQRVVQHCRDQIQEFK